MRDDPNFMGRDELDREFRKYSKCDQSDCENAHALRLGALCRRTFEVRAEYYPGFIALMCGKCGTPSAIIPVANEATSENSQCLN